MSDSDTSFATVPLDELLAAMEKPACLYTTWVVVSRPVNRIGGRLDSW